ncbi:hypothetical protein C8Q78DRAFT_1046767 [Trametes maxima]|nr:hypothetical protein C8Q78DRAFT_1046767 [Trametes maxima]
MPPLFQRDLAAPLETEFLRLAAQHGWNPDSARYRNERFRFYGDAVLQDFTRHWGDNDSRLEAWQALCYHLGKAGPYTSIIECKKALKNVHVNLIDLVESKNSARKLRKFTTARALAAYTRETMKIFPKRRAKENPLLKQFLVVVFQPNNW